MIEPTERLLWSVVVVGVVGAAAIAVPAVGVVAPLLLGALALLVVVDGVLAPSPSSVQVRRHFPVRPVQGRDLAVVLELEGRGRRVVDVEITDTLPGVGGPGRPWWTQTVSVGPNEVVSVQRQERFARRGLLPMGRFALRTTGPLGLLRRRQRRDAVGDAVDVGLDLAAILGSARRLVRGSESEGSRRKRAIERGRDFDALREYRRGDDVRLVDWKATARQGNLIVKELVPETRQDIVIVLDAGRQMVPPDAGVHSTDSQSADATAPGAAGLPRFETALSTALVLAAAALEKNDRVGLVVMADEVLAFVPPGNGTSQLKRLADAARSQHPLAVEPAYQALSQFLIARLKRRALVVLITDVVDEVSARSLSRALLSLRGRHLVAVAAMGDPGLHGSLKTPKTNTGTSTSGLGRDADPVAGHREAAARQLLHHRRRGLAAIEGVGAMVVDAVSHRAAAGAVDAYLTIKAQGRL